MTVCALLWVILGVALIASSLHIYFTGGANPYSREIAGKYLSYIAAPFALVVLFTFYCAVVIPSSEDGIPRVKLAKETVAKNLYKRYSITTLPESALKRLYETKRKRVTVNVIFYAISAVLLIFAFVYLLLADFTKENLNSDVISAISVVLPTSLLAILIHAPKDIYIDRLIEEECSIVRMAEKKTEDSSVDESKTLKKLENTKDYKPALILGARVAVCAVGILFIVLGAMNGGMNDVLGKAIKICTECIGLG